MKLLLEQSCNIHNGPVVSGLIAAENRDHNIFYFAAEQESVCIRKKQVNVTSAGHDIDVRFL